MAKKSTIVRVIDNRVPQTVADFKEKTAGAGDDYNLVMHDAFGVMITKMQESIGVLDFNFKPCNDPILTFKCDGSQDYVTAKKVRAVKNFDKARLVCVDLNGDECYVRGIQVDDSDKSIVLYL